jgi:hypothetical protein
MSGGNSQSQDDNQTLISSVLHKYINGRLVDKAQ